MTLIRGSREQLYVGEVMWGEKILAVIAVSPEDVERLRDTGLSKTEYWLLNLRPGMRRDSQSYVLDPIKSELSVEIRDSLLVPQIPGDSDPIIVESK